ncbi:hypothetical protein GQ457_04G036070 [Hibiscus cannabinus]
MSPVDCLLFDERSGLKPTDGPFIDEGFYGSEIRTYRKELYTIGVTIDAEKRNTLLASHLNIHSDFATRQKFVMQRNSSKEHFLSESLMKVPVDSGPGRISLFNKHDVFIADDLQLKDLFIQSSSRPLFVWYPQPCPCLLLLPQTVLFELY